MLDVVNLCPLWSLQQNSPLRFRFSQVLHRTRGVCTCTHLLLLQVSCGFCLLTELFLTRLWGCLTPQKTGPTNSYNYTLKEQLILNGVKHILRHRVGKFWCLSRFRWHRAPEPPAPPGWGEELEGPSVSAAKGLIPSQPLCFYGTYLKLALPSTCHAHHTVMA